VDADVGVDADGGLDDLDVDLGPPDDGFTDFDGGGDIDVDLGPPDDGEGDLDLSPPDDGEIDIDIDVDLGPPDDGGVDLDADGGPPDYDVFSITGTSNDLMTGSASPEGVCVGAIKRGDMDTDGTAVSLGSSRIATEGYFEMTDVRLISGGIYLRTMTCPAEEGDAAHFKTMVPIKSTDIIALSDGDTLASTKPVTLEVSKVNSFKSSVDIAGGTGNIKTDGFVVGRLRTSTGAILSGATINCGGCDVYYFDGTGADGWFSDDTGALHTETSSAGKGRFLIAGPFDGAISVSSADADFSPKTIKTAANHCVYASFKAF
jgi:hypothetical protein